MTVRVAATQVAMSTTSVVHGYLIVLEQTQKNPKKPKAQLNPIKPTGAGSFKKTRVFFNPVLPRLYAIRPSRPLMIFMILFDFHAPSVKSLTGNDAILISG